MARGEGRFIARTPSIGLRHCASGNGVTFAVAKCEPDRRELTQRRPQAGTFMRGGGAHPRRARTLERADGGSGSTGENPDAAGTNLRERARAGLFERLLPLTLPAGKPVQTLQVLRPVS